MSSLSEYTTTGATAFDFVPSCVLYRTYLTFLHRFVRDNDSPDILNTRQFGVALVRVLGLEGRRVRHQIAGKQVWGYTGILGPGSIVLSGRMGNPKWRKHDIDETTTAPATPPPCTDGTEGLHTEGMVEGS